MRFGKVRLQLQSLFVAGHRSVQISLVFERIAEVIVRGGKGRSELQGPSIACHSGIRTLVNKVNLVIPPLFLCLGFFLGALMMFDEPTGAEEEIGELFFSLCFVLFMLYEYFLRRDSPSRRPHFKCSSDIKFVALGVGVMFVGFMSIVLI